ncbi:MAG: tetratricopeptide repeat protein [Planctomycetia bacterium]|nr:tetratricopeptide repeat protein [Planctomycetia bacterium]
MSRIALIWLAGISLLMMGSRIGTAADMKKQVQEVLDTGWQVGTTSLNSAEEKYDAALQAAPGDARVEYSWALVLIKQHRYDRALEQLDLILKQHRDDQTALMWKIRIKAITKKYPAALVDLQQLAKTIPASPGDAEQEPKNMAVARFMGRAFGFLEGPADISASQRDDAKPLVVAHLEGDRRQAFDEARAAVLDQFDKLKHQREGAKVDSQQKQEQDKQQKKEQVDSERGKLDKELTDVSAERERMLEQQRREEGEVNRQMRRAEQAESQAQANLAPVMSQWNSIQIQRMQWVGAAEAEQDPGRKQLIYNQIASIDASLAGIDGQRRVLENAVLQARNMRAQAAQGMMDVRRRYQNTGVALDKREANARKGQGRLTGQQKRIDRSTTTGSSARERNLATKAAAYPSYEELPLDTEKAKLIASFE